MKRKKATPPPKKKRAKNVHFVNILYPDITFINLIRSFYILHKLKTNTIFFLLRHRCAKPAGFMRHVYVHRIEDQPSECTTVVIRNGHSDGWTSGFSNCSTSQKFDLSTPSVSIVRKFIFWPECINRPIYSFGPIHLGQKNKFLDSCYTWVILKSNGRFRWLNLRLVEHSEGCVLRRLIFGSLI